MTRWSSGSEIHIDSDNAMGSPRGNVDDGFAIAALLRSAVEVVGLSSIGGNAPETEAASNNESLAEILRWRGPQSRGARRAGERDTEASLALAAYDRPVTVLALGPLTNVAGALERRTGAIQEVVLVGSNPSSKGRWPPIWPHESNLTWDRDATVDLFGSDTDLTIVPLDVVGQLRAGRDELERLPGAIGAYLRNQSERWLIRKTRWSVRRSFRIPDLVAAMLVIAPNLFEVDDVRVTAHHNGWIEYGQGRPARAVRRFDGAEVWDYFASLLATRVVHSSHEKSHLHS